LQDGKRSKEKFNLLKLRQFISETVENPPISKPISKPSKNHHKTSTNPFQLPFKL
jgi:hypothetical protein